jgi:SAM-dependent methyltransferase
VAHNTVIGSTAPSLEYVNCPVCEADHTRRFLASAPQDIVRCRGCGLIYVNPRPRQDEVRNFFGEHYIPDEEMLTREFGAWRATALKREADLVKRFKARGRILDVGCAGGQFLTHFVNDGWECHGVEPSQKAAEHALRRKIHVHCGLLEDAAIPAQQSFDVVTYLDALYFSRTPREDLRKIKSLLKRDGILIIELPGFYYRIVKNVGPVSLLVNHRWCHLRSVSPHLYYFSDSNLRMLLHKTGFEIECQQLEPHGEKGSAALRFAGRCYFAASRFVFVATLGKINLAAKVAYVCRRTG